MDTGPPDGKGSRPPEEKVGFWKAVGEDLAYRGHSRYRWLFLPWCLLGSRGFLVVFLYRVGRALRWTRIAPWICRRIGILLTHASIHETAEIGEALVIPHATGLTIGRNVKIGKGVYLYSGVILGPRGLDEGPRSAPVIGDFVHIYPHACVFGNITVGECTEIGANSVLLESVPPNTVVMPPASTIFRGMAFAMAGFLSEPGEKKNAEKESVEKPA